MLTIAVALYLLLLPVTLVPSAGGTSDVLGWSLTAVGLTTMILAMYLDHRSKLRVKKAYLYGAIFVAGGVLMLLIS